MKKKIKRDKLEPYKISATIYTNEELEELDYKIGNELDNIVNQVTDAVLTKRELIVLQKVIEKQQKEIENLKAITKEYEAYSCGEDEKIVIASKEYFINGFFKDFLSDYISKDKIKEKIEELKNRKIGASTGIFAVQVDILEELLQGGQESDQEGGQEDE